MSSGDNRRGKRWSGSVPRQRGDPVRGVGLLLYCGFSLTGYIFVRFCGVITDRLVVLWSHKLWRGLSGPGLR